MKRYPYTLEMWYEEDATMNSDGSWTSGFSEWRTVCRCNVHQNGKASQVMLSDGTLFTYSYEVVLPSKTKRIEENTKVRVIRDGINLFDGKPKDESLKSYRVAGYNPFKQRNEDLKLWL